MGVRQNPTRQNPTRHNPTRQYPTRQNPTATKSHSDKIPHDKIPPKIVNPREFNWILGNVFSLFFYNFLILFLIVWPIPCRTSTTVFLPSFRAVHRLNRRSCRSCVALLTFQTRSRYNSAADKDIWIIPKKLGNRTGNYTFRNVSDGQKGNCFQHSTKLFHVVVILVSCSQTKLLNFPPRTLG